MRKPQTFKLIFLENVILQLLHFKTLGQSSSLALADLQVAICN